MDDSIKKRQIKFSVKMGSLRNISGHIEVTNVKTKEYPESGSWRNTFELKILKM